MQDGCDPKVNVPTEVAADGFALVVERSPNCTFEARAWAAEAVGASAMVVRNSIEGIYQNRTYTTDQTDYECDNGQSWTSSTNDKFEGYTHTSCAKDDGCESGRCVLTGDTDTSKGYKICCAWDMYMTMASADDSAAEITIPSLFVTMTDYDALLDHTLSSTEHRTISVYDRWRPWMNLSSLLIWAMGVATVAYASWRSVDDLRRKMSRPVAAFSGGVPASKEGSGGPVVLDEEEAPALELTLAHAFGWVWACAGPSRAYTYTFICVNADVLPYAT